jgi:hypothetical protein
MAHKKVEKSTQKTVNKGISFSSGRPRKVPTAAKHCADTSNDLRIVS